MEFTKPLPYPEAVDKIGRKSIIGSKLDSAAWERLPVAIRERAFWSATIESVRFLQRSRDMIGDFMTAATETVVGPDGVSRTALKVGSRADFIKQASAFAIKEGMGPLDPKDVGTMKDIRSEKRLGLIFDIQTGQCYSHANWKQGMDEDTLNEFPAQRFIRITVVIKQRVIHQQNEGVVRLKTDLEFWLGMNSPTIGGFGVPWGPWGFGSGMGEEDVDRNEAESLGLIKPGETLQPVEKDLNEHLEASLKGLDPDMVKLIKDTLGDLVEVDGGSVRWKSNKPGVQPTAPQPSPAPATPPQPAPNTPQPSAPASAPTNTPQPQPAAPATPRETLDDVLKRLNIDQTGKAKAADMIRLREELKEANPVQLSTVMRNISGKSSNFTQDEVKQALQEFIDFIPPHKALKLPPLTVSIANLPPNHLGGYSANGRLEVASAMSASMLRETVFHELMHWLHREGDQAFKDLIQQHFEQRTVGEPVVRLPGFGPGINGKTDKWRNSYAGRIYPFEVLNKGVPGGLEVPTVHIEWLAKSPALMAADWNSPAFRETLLIVLKGLF